jgi:hypothetical protein
VLWVCEGNGTWISGSNAMASVSLLPQQLVAQGGFTRRGCAAGWRGLLRRGLRRVGRRQRWMLGASPALTGIEGASSRPVRKIVRLDG